MPQTTSKVHINQKSGWPNWNTEGLYDTRSTSGGYYSWKGKPELTKVDELGIKVLEIFHRSRGLYGVKRVKAAEDLLNQNFYSQNDLKTEHKNDKIKI